MSKGKAAGKPSAFFVMSVIPIEVVRGEHKIAEHAVGPFSVGEILPISEAAGAFGATTVKSAALGEMLGKPVWRVEKDDGAVMIIDALSGEVLSPLNEQRARQIAVRDYNGSGEFKSIALIETPPSEYSKPGPVWRAQFDDRDKTKIYVDPSKGGVTARRSDTWQFYDFFWKCMSWIMMAALTLTHRFLLPPRGQRSSWPCPGLFC